MAPAVGLAADFMMKSGAWPVAVRRPLGGGVAQLGHEHGDVDSRDRNAT